MPPADKTPFKAETQTSTDQCPLYRTSSGNCFSWTAEDGYSATVACASVYRILPQAKVLETTAGTGIWAPVNIALYHDWAGVVDAEDTHLQSLPVCTLIRALKVRRAKIANPN